MKKRSLQALVVAAGSVVLGAVLMAADLPAVDAPKPAAPAVDPSTVVLTVGDSKMTAADFDEFISGLPPEVQNAARGPQKRRVAEDVVKMKLLAAEAQKQGLDQTAKFKQQMQMMRENALAGALFSSLQNKLVNDDDVKKYYEEHKGDFERVTAKHILIATGGEKNLSDADAKAKADDIKKKIEKNPDDFAVLAKQESDDPGSKNEGGKLSPFLKGQMLPEFEKVAFSLIKPGEISEPVKTRYGYHVIVLEKHEPAPLEDVKEDIVDQLRPQKLEQVVEDLKKKSEVKLDEAFFGPAVKPASAEGGNKAFER